MFSLPLFISCYDIYIFLRNPHSFKYWDKDKMKVKVANMVTKPSEFFQTFSKKIVMHYMVCFCTVYVFVLQKSYNDLYRVFEALCEVSVSCNVTSHLQCICIAKSKEPEVQPIKWIQVILRLLFHPAGFYKGYISLTHWHSWAGKSFSSRSS